MSCPSFQSQQMDAVCVCCTQADPEGYVVNPTITGGGGLLHDGKGDGALERVRHFCCILQVVRHRQGRRPMHLLMPVIPLPVTQVS